MERKYQIIYDILRQTPHSYFEAPLRRVGLIRLDDDGDVVVHVVEEVFDFHHHSVVNLFKQ